MFVGTCSDVGKSVINTGFCRILLQDGYRPAPFKAQNLSLNSYATPEGLEIGRAQATQAEACGITPHVDMNPVLLKPGGEGMAQLVLHGKPVDKLAALDYYRQPSNALLFEEAYAAFRRLAKSYAPIVLEGAGAIAELNLQQRDIVNMRMAKRVGADVYLVADIDRGGVFASVYGALMLLPPDERKLIKGVIINKFRGDTRLFADGRRMIEELCGIPVVGVVPFFTDIYIEDEDAVSLDGRNARAVDDKVNVAVVQLPHISNFTDFDALEFDERVHLYYSLGKHELAKADIVILPGTKSTIHDLQFIAQRGIPDLLHQLIAQGKSVIGICGGYQMMGTCIHDPNQLEGGDKEANGMGLLPIETTIEVHKKTVQQEFYFLDNIELCKGYEIHMGQSDIGLVSTPLVKTLDGHFEGTYLNVHCWGTYMHGILDNQVVIDHLLAPYTNKSGSKLGYSDFKEQSYNRLADHLRKYINVDAICREAGIG